MHRFHLPSFDSPVLPPAELHHARQVLRIPPGETITVFDGRGHSATAQFDPGGSLRLLQHSHTAAVPCQLTLAQAMPKRTMDLVVQKATELGVATLIPLQTERTIVKLDEDAKKLDRWREIALESCKQCGNNWLPVIAPPTKLTALLPQLGNYDLKLIAALQPDARPLKPILAETPAARRTGASVLVLIGPEGDFTPEEVASARAAGCQLLSLGSLVLRAETAAIYALSVLQHEWQPG